MGSVQCLKTANLSAQGSFRYAVDCGHPMFWHAIDVLVEVLLGHHLRAASVSYLRKGAMAVAGRFFGRSTQSVP